MSRSGLEIQIAPSLAPNGRTSTVESLYSDGSPVLDPVFLALRRQFFDPTQRWSRIESGLSPTFTSISMGPAMLGARCLTSAFGWEQRPWLKPGLLDNTGAAQLLGTLNGRKDWESCEINMLTETEARALREACLTSGNACFAFPMPIRVISGSKSYEQYYSEFNPHTRKYLRQLHRRRETRGFEIRRELEWESIEKLLDLKQMKHARGGDYTKSPEFRGFWRAYREELRKSGRLREIGIFKDGRPAAITSSFETAGVVHVYQTAYDPGFPELSLGTLSMLMNVEVALNSGAAVVDFMNDTKQLRSLTTETLGLQRFVMCSRSVAGRLLAANLSLRSVVKDSLQVIRGK